MKRHPRREIPRIVAPALTITQHAGGGFTIAYGNSSLHADGPSLDAAWKRYCRVVDDFNAQLAHQRASAPADIAPPEHSPTASTENNAPPSLVISAGQREEVAALITEADG